MSEEKKAAPAKKGAKQVFVMKRAGITEGASGATYSHAAGQELEVSKGEFAHLDAKTCEEKK